MLYSALVAAALASLAAAQNSTSNLPTNFPACCTPPTAPNSTVSQQWCNANTNTCIQACGDNSQVAANGNTCDAKTLKFTCRCKNSTEPDMAQYQQSVPALQCREWYSQCVIAAGDGFESAEWKRTCEENLNSRCGNLTLKNSDSSSASGSASTALPSRTSSDSSSPTNSQAPAATSSGAAAVAVAREFGFPVLAGGLVALFGFAL